MKSYQPEELFDANGTLMPELAELAPTGNRRMGANPHANGGLFLRDLELPDFREYAVDVPKPGTVTAEATRVTGGFLRDVMKLNLDQQELPRHGARRDSRQTGLMHSLKSRIALGWLRSYPTTIIWLPMAASWRF